MSVDKVRLLVRVANRLKDNSDRQALIEWADEISSELQPN